ncbi:MAG: hypothetical protein HYZ53_07090 [Planctomycetes bacterium]|nr:hypothetical protein [Planctomycetota bacterium]
MRRISLMVLCAAVIAGMTTSKLRAEQPPAKEPVRQEAAPAPDSSNADEPRTAAPSSTPGYPPPPQSQPALKSQPTGQPAFPPPGATGPCGTWVLVPPKFRTTNEQVLVRPAGKRFEFIPPRYETRTQQVLVTPATVRCTAVPAVIEMKTERVLVSPARKEWRLVPCTEIALAAGEIQGASWCFVDVPPVYDTRTHEVVASPAGVKREEIPAVYKTVEYQALVSEGTWKEIPVPPVFETRTRTEKVAEAHWEWRTSKECRETTVAPPPPPPPKSQHIPRARCGCDPRDRR